MSVSEIYHKILEPLDGENVGLSFDKSLEVINIKAFLLFMKKSRMAKVKNIADSDSRYKKALRQKL